MARAFESRLGRIAEAQADGLLDPRQGALHLGVEIIRVFAAIVVEGRAEVGGDGETGRHRQADPGHLRQVRPLAAEQVAHFGAALVMAGSEVVDPLVGSSDVTARWCLNISLFNAFHFEATQYDSAKQIS